MKPQVGDLVGVDTTHGPLWGRIEGLGHTADNMTQFRLNVYHVDNKWWWDAEQVTHKFWVENRIEAPPPDTIQAQHMAWALTQKDNDDG